MVSDEEAVEFKDVTGLTLKEGMKVAWGVGGRYNYGLSLGQVERIFDEEKETYRFNADTRQHEKVKITVRQMTLKSLDAGRKGRTVGAGFPVVIIADQDYAGTK